MRLLSPSSQHIYVACVGNGEDWQLIGHLPRLKFSPFTKLQQSQTPGRLMLGFRGDGFHEDGLGLR